MDPTLAEPWQRLLARIVDTVVISLITLPPLFWFLIWELRQLPAAFPADLETPSDIDRVTQMEFTFLGYSALLALASALVYFLYDWLQHARWGQTIGKRIMKIKVVAISDRTPVTGGAAAKRAAIQVLAPQVPGVGIFGLVDTLWLLWDKPNRQCLHDKFAGTVVVKTRIPPAG
jgi:uncharacterized RDD family membrane protein YckC